MIPCELVVTKLLPTIRRQAVIRLLKLGKNQREVARELGLTEAAVSHYVAKRRAGKKDRLMDDIIAVSMKKNYKNGKAFGENVCSICKNLRKSKELCVIHMRFGVLKPEKSECDVCRSTAC